MDWAYERWADVRNRGGSLMVMSRTIGQLDDFIERARAHLRDTGELKGPDVSFGNLDVAIGDELVTRRDVSTSPEDRYLARAMVSIGQLMLGRAGRPLRAGCLRLPKPPRCTVEHHG